MRTLKLFNAVVAKKEKLKVPFVSEDGFVIEPDALWAKDKIVAYYKSQALDGNALNKTFHKSWAKIKNSPRGELLIHQILHYLTGYGTNFQAETYIPDELVNIPGLKVSFKTVKAYSKAELIEKALDLLRSGVALKEETIDDILSVLTVELGYRFTGHEGIRNKEATVKIADLYGVIPQDFMGFFRYILFRTTNETLIIKNPKTIQAIKASSYNPMIQFEKFGLQRLAEHFNRFKPLFLAFKIKCPATINRISKLSKTLHKPMVQNPLNLVTQRKLKAADNHWLDNATPFALFKALSACWSRQNGQDIFVYKIRNGKSWVTTGTPSATVAQFNQDYLLRYLKTRISLKGKKIFIPEDVQFALPTSEKMFVGNIPTGSKFYGSRLAVGIYWENAWGARDLDLSAARVDGKVGWDSAFQRGDGELMFSGDITNAPNGAVEYLYANQTLKGGPALVQVNVFAMADYNDEGKEAGYRIIVGRGDNINKDFMMNPNKLFLQEKVSTVQKQNIIGLLTKEGKQQVFVLLNMGSGQARVSGYDDHSQNARAALVQEFSNPITFNSLVVALGAKLVTDRTKANVDLSLDVLEKDSFTKLF